MHILITGARGQLGSSLLDSAPAQVRVTATDVGELDLADPRALRAGLDAACPDVIVNAGAFTAVDRAEAEPQLAHAVNAAAVQVIANYCVATGCRLVQISTDYVFAGDSGRPYRPDDPTGALSVYGRTKLDGEVAAATAGDLARILRSCWVYSEHGSNFVKTMLRLAGEREQLTVVDDQTGSPTYARNIATAIWGMVNHWPAEPVLHYADAGEVTWKGFAEAIFAEAFDLGLITRIPQVSAISTADYAAPAPRPAYSALDASLLTTHLGLPAQDWRAALRDMLARHARGVLLPNRLEISGS